MTKSQNLPRTRAPKIRGWGRAGRKVISMVIPTKKEKLQKRNRRKEELRREIQEAKTA